MTRDKAIGLFMLRMNGVFSVFHRYGMDVYVLPAKEQILELAMDFHNNMNQADFDESTDNPDD